MDFALLSFLSLLPQLWEERKIIVQNFRGLSRQSDCLLTAGNKRAIQETVPKQVEEETPGRFCMRVKREGPSP